MNSENIGLAAAIAVVSGRTPTVMRGPEGRAYFHFADDPQLDAIRDAYYNGSLTGSLRDYNAVTRDLLARMREVARGR